MKATLYGQANDIETMYEKIEAAKLLRGLFQGYEGNPVLSNAIQGRQSVEESLEELGRVNIGIRRILPWRRNKGHNERLKQLGELVSEPYHLRTSGIFTPDNLITGGIYVTAMLFGIGYYLSRYIEPSLASNPNVSPEEFQQFMFNLRVLLPAATSAIVSPACGLMTGIERFNGLPTDEAKYLDGKVQEFYK